jgi:hypothetical protein
MAGWDAAVAADTGTMLVAVSSPATAKALTDFTFPP